MRYPFIMKIVECFADLLEEPPTNILLHLPIQTLMLDILVQRNARYIICDDTDLLVGFY